MKRKQKSRLYSEHGFTLIESTLVVIVIGMIAIIAVPRIVSTDRHAVYIAGHQVTADMRHARGLAIANVEDYTVRFNLIDGAYTGYDILRAADGSVLKSMDIPEPVDCTITDGAGADWNITFTLLGAAKDSDGALISSATEIMSLDVDGSHTQNINVIGATGRIWENEPAP